MEQALRRYTPIVRRIAINGTQTARVSITGNLRMLISISRILLTFKRELPKCVRRIKDLTGSYPPRKSPRNPRGNSITPPLILATAVTPNRIMGPTKQCQIPTIDTNLKAKLNVETHN